MLYEIYQYHGMVNQRVCYTIHNFKHQGICGNEQLIATGLKRPDYYFDYSRLRDNFNPFALNMMKGGIVYSNAVTTVSPHHAWEARCLDEGNGLGHTLHLYQDKFKGILNGVISFQQKYRQIQLNMLMSGYAHLKLNTLKL